MSEHSNCDILSNRTEEYNQIAMFFEWLQDTKHYILARYSTEEQLKESGYIFNEYPMPVGRNIQDLLYEYFGIDPTKLEQERRKMLKDFQK